VALDLFEASRLKIVKYVPISKESKAFAASKDMYAIGSLDYTGLLPPSHTMNWVKVLHAIYIHVPHTANAGFFNMIPLKPSVCTLR
jgi:hypothetical protein